MSEALHGSSPSRRRFLTGLAGAAGAAALGVFGRPDQARAQYNTEKPPNVLLIISDDQNWDDYSFMGHPHIETPHLDRLAAQSRTFTRGYVPAPLCCPSLASMVTGLYPHQHKITSNDPPAVGDHARFAFPPERLALREEFISHIDDVHTLPTLLRARGYRSLQTGKWWQGHYSRGGFSHGMTHGDPERGGRHGDAGLTIGREGLDPIREFVEADRDSPWFIWFAPFLPHAPHTPPQRLLAKYQEKVESEAVARYYAMCEWWDEVCGELLGYLDEQGLAENTLVLYVVDNGWIQKPDEANQFAPRSKTTAYEGGIRTPIMARWPGQIEAKRDDTTLVSSIDLAPTILRAAKLDPTEGMHGLNLLDAEAFAQRNAVFGGQYSHDAVDIHEPVSSLQRLWVVEGWWKLINPAGGSAVEGGPELYNLQDDPYEKKDLAAAHPEKVAHLRQRIRDWWPEGGKTLVEAGESA